MALICFGRRSNSSRGAAGRSRRPAARRGLLQRADDGSFRFDPRDPDLAAAVAKLAQLYPTYRLAVVTSIYSPR